ncbi:MAG TPA: HD domain-containing protein [Nitriliruptorales bacterium]
MTQLLRRTRTHRERDEAERLAPAATRSAESKGREVDEPEDAYRTAFERDRDRILHSKAFRRLKHKTQVFINPEGDHFVTRLTHTMQVAQVGRSIAAALGLNESLTEAICLGHDVGHSPFGHTGEVALTPYLAQRSPTGEWQHAIQSVRIVRKLEPLNLTAEVLDGIRASSWKNDPPPSSPEGYVCRFADRIAYLAHDAIDAMRGGVLERDDIPTRFIDQFGEPGRAWVDTMVTDVIEASAREGRVTMDAEVLDVMHDLRDFMFRSVYLRDDAKAQADKAIKVIRDLVDWFIEHPQDVPEGYKLGDSDELQAAVDYVSGMSDKYAMRVHDQIYRPLGLF